MIQVQQLELDTEQDHQSPKRWLVVIAFSTLGFANTMNFVSYSPIWSSAASYYNVSSENLNWLLNMYLVTYIVFPPFMNYFIRKRFHTMLQIAGVFTALGAWTIWAAQNNFSLALLGYGFIGLSQSIFLQCPVCKIFHLNKDLSEMWFSAYERTLVISLTGYSLLIGSAFSYTYSSYYFFNVTDSIQINDGIQHMNLIIAWMNTVGLIGCFLLIKSKEQPIFETINWMEQYKKIITTEESIIDLLVFGIFIGVQWQYINVLSLQLYNYGFDQEQIGLTGVINQFGGAIGGIVIALIIDRDVRQGIQPNYDIYIKISTSVGLFFLIIEVFLVEKFNFATLIFINFLIGLGLYPCYPLFFASCSEKIFPTQSLVILTVLLIIGNVVAFGLGYLIIQPAFLPYGIWISIILISPGQLYILLNFKTKYKKFEQMI